MTKPISASALLSKKRENNNNIKPTRVLVKISISTTPSNVPPDAQKWTSLFHNGVLLPPPYKPHGVKMLYKGCPVHLSPQQEEVATMYAGLLDNEYYMNNRTFRDNFMADWQKVLGKDHVIQSLEDCDFTPIYEWHQNEMEKRKQMTSEEKKALREEKVHQDEKYMWAIVDGVKEKVENSIVGPPGLFRGRGQHPKIGKLKRRIRPSDITINIGKDAPVPDCPFPGESWKKIVHDNTVNWLAYWKDPINPKQYRYVLLTGRIERERYEKARLLKNYIKGIRAAYTDDFTSDDMAKRQLAVATYLMDKLSISSCNEKDNHEYDTISCCALKVENFELVPPNILKYNYLGPDSRSYQNIVEVEKAVFEAIQQFQSGKNRGDYLFDKFDIVGLNAHLNSLMPGLTAKDFRTYNASITLDDILSRLTTKGVDVRGNLDVYTHTIHTVATICNHKRTIFRKLCVDERSPGVVKKMIEYLCASFCLWTIDKMECDEETKYDQGNMILSTSKISDLDPRITFAWCKRNEVPVERIFNKRLMGKFAWAVDVDPGFRY